MKVAIPDEGGTEGVKDQASGRQSAKEVEVLRGSSETCRFVQWGATREGWVMKTFLEKPKVGAGAGSYQVVTVHPDLEVRMVLLVKDVCQAGNPVPNVRVKEGGTGGGGQATLVLHELPPRHFNLVDLRIGNALSSCQVLELS